MGIPATVRTLALIALAVGSALGQIRPDWRRIGNASVDASLSAVATGAAERVWYSADGGRLFTRTRSGRVFETTDFEIWKPSSEKLPARAASPIPTRMPEAAAQLQAGQGTRLYAIGRFAWRSEDQGASWTNLTAYKNDSIVGEGLFDVAVSPRDDQEITLATASGVWRTVDGGASWSGMNETLPNLPIRRILSLPAEGRGARVARQTTAPQTADQTRCRCPASISTAHWVKSSIALGLSSGSILG